MSEKASPWSALSIALALVALSGCVGPGSPTTAEQADSESLASSWVCVENETAFGERNLGCRIRADYVEGATVIMSFRMFCSIDADESEGYVISRFSGQDFGGNLVGWRKRAEASFDGGPKEEILLRPLRDAFILESEHFGYDALTPGNFTDTVHFKVLPQNETMLIRATIEPERLTTTSLFTWGDFSEPISFLSERGCDWY